MRLRRGLFASSALLPDRSDIDTDASDANALFEKLGDEDCLIYAHVGGRYADLAVTGTGQLLVASIVDNAGVKQHTLTRRSAWNEGSCAFFASKFSSDQLAITRVELVAWS